MIISLKIRTGSGNKLEFESGSADLIIVCQAVHWFDVPKFYEEAKRVLSPGGAVAILSYTPHQLTSDEKGAKELNALMIEVTVL